MDSYVVNLNELKSDGVIKCPYCHKGKSYSYGEQGMQSIPCRVCGKIVLWDCNKMRAYQANARKFTDK